MIMRPGQQLLLPANPIFIWTTLVLALLTNFVQGIAFWGGGAPWQPDVLALVLVFWSVHQPRRVSVAAAFVFGLLMDVHQAGLLGEHALAYVCMCYLAITIHRRLLWFPVPMQSFQVLPLFIVAHGLSLASRLMIGGNFPGLSLLLAPALEAMLWPIVSVLLLIPQKRAPDPDVDRPL